MSVFSTALPAESVAAEPLLLRPETTVIALPDDAAGRAAGPGAMLLQRYLRKRSGTEGGFAVVSRVAADAAAKKAVLALGPSAACDAAELARLGPHDFVLRRQDRVVTIAGRGDQGSLLAAVAFLDRVCGVRFYMPGELFTHVPPGGPVAVGDLDVLETPYVKSCLMSGIGGVPGERDWSARNGVSRRLGGTHQHNMFALFPPEKYAARCPEIYPMLDGRRYVPADAADQRWQPCFSEAKTVDAAEASAIAYFRQHPDHAYLAASINDGQKVCQCDRCQAAYGPFIGKDPKLGLAQGHSAVYWEFLDRLASRLEAKLPGKLLVGLAYGPTRFPPAKKLHANILVFTNFHIAELPADGILKPGAAGVSPLDAWLAVASHYGNHDWYHGMGYLLPRIYTGFWAEYMQTLNRSGAGRFMHAEAYPNWGLDGPKLYVVARLWWNPGADVPALWKRLCADLFGPAAEPMHDYFMKLERLWTELDTVEGPERKLHRYGTQFKTEPKDREQIRQCRALLDEAAAKAVDAASRRRVDLFSKTFRLSESLFELAADPSPRASRVEDLKRYAREAILPDPMTLHGAMRKIEVIEQAIGQVTAGKKLAP